MSDGLKESTMIQLSHAADALLDRCLACCNERHAPQSFGSFFQHAVAQALGRIDRYRGCYANPGAGQPDVIAGDTGFEVKTHMGVSIELTGNYAAIRTQYARFRLIFLRTDLRPFQFGVLEVPETVPRRINLGAAVAEGLTVDADLEIQLGNELSATLEAVGTDWSDAQSPDQAREVLQHLLRR